MIKKTYGKMTQEEASELTAHLRECSSCARIHEKIEPLEPLFSDEQKIPLPDWEQSWKYIASRSLAKKKTRFFPASFPRWAYAAAALALVFGLGFLAGRRLLNSPESALPVAAVAGPQSPFVSYAENLEPLLVGFLNQGDQPVPEEFLLLEKALLSDMLQQTRLLKRLALNQDQDHLQEMLDDLEFILIGISNLKPQDLAAAERLKAMIREKELKFRLKTLAAPEETF